MAAAALALAALLADGAAAPEQIVGEWQLWDGGKLWQAPRVRVVDAALGAAAEEEAEGERADHPDTPDLLVVASTSSS